MMARFFFYLAFLMMPLLLQGQQQPEWFHVGAEWYYRLTYGNIPPGNYTYNMASIVDTTIINNTVCKKLSWDKDIECEGAGAGKYVYHENNKVYYYNKVVDSFRLLYDFNAKVGDTWQISKLRSDTPLSKFNYNNIVFQVDSVDSIAINGHNLKALYIHDTVADGTSIGLKRELKVIQYIGCTYTFFPWSTTIRIEDCAGKITNPLRCYNAADFGMYKTPYFSGPCDTVITSLQEPPSPSKPRVSISPHPVKHTSTIQLTTPKSRKVNDAKCTIYDPLGRKIDKLPTSSSTVDGVQFQINASSWEAGVYIYRISSAQEQLKTGKMMVD